MEAPVNYDKAIISKDSFIKNFNTPSGKYLYWTDDINTELPVIITPGDEIPLRTLTQLFKTTAKHIPKAIAFRVKRKNNKDVLKEQQWTWEQYYSDCNKFACSLVKFGISERKSVNIIGFNAPEWAISFFGSIFANCIASGVYTTNNAEACFYQADHSEAELIVVENEEQIAKYISVLDRLPLIKALVVYNDDAGRLRNKYQAYQKFILGWSEFLALGGDYNDKNGIRIEVRNRKHKQRPGNCCNIVYTSGTTGPPKGVMLSHDNMIYNNTIQLNSLVNELNWQTDGSERMLSYLPLSHSAGQSTDLLLPLVSNCTLTFARPDALQGSLIETLKEVRPTLFFAVPRVWEKIEEKLRELGASQPGILQSVANWAKDKAYLANLSTQTITDKPQMPLTYPVAKFLILNRIKAALGLDQAKIYVYAAAPLSRKTQEYFMSLDMPIAGIFGMTESAAPVTTWTMKKNKHFTCGVVMPGCQVKLDNPDKDGVGEICMKGRNMFMGYYKNEKATMEMYDTDGFIHSGDLGTLKDGFLEITGRIKELIITAGGENIAPVMIEYEFKESCPMCSNIMIVGDNRKFLSAIIALKVNMDPKNGTPTHQLTNECRNQLGKAFREGDKLSTVQEGIQSEDLKAFISKCMETTNSKAISRAHHLRKWIIVENDFSVAGGELTPSLKMKRKVIELKYSDKIEKMYQEAKL